MLKMEFRHKALFENDFALYNELVRIDSALPIVFDDVLEEIENYDPSVLKFWEDSGLKPKLAGYLLYFIVPFYELLRNQKRDFDTKLLAAQVLSSFAWRTFDNCVDGHEPPKKAHLVSLISSMHFIGFIRTIAEQKNIVFDTQQHYKMMAEQAVREEFEPIELENIWKKCSIMIYVPESVAFLNQESIQIYKNYINYLGLAHDLEDIVSDLANGVVSLPIFWIRKINSRFVINMESIRLLYDKAEKSLVLIENKFKIAQIEIRFPLLDHLFRTSRPILQSHN